MKKFSGWQYLLIDVANNFGLDKQNWDVRIKWTEDNIEHLEDFVNEASNRMLYIKSVHALRDVLAGEATGHMMGIDACSSGVQIMSALIGDHKGAANCGLINTGHREDFYTNLVTEMNRILPEHKQIGIGAHLTHKNVKQAGMTSLYGSKAAPRNLFGEDSEELDAFYNAMQNLVPGALEVMEDLLECWNPHALNHTFTLPDGHTASIDVLVPVEKRIEIDELDHHTFTYRAHVNMPDSNGVSIVANVVQAVDAYIAREMIRKAYAQGIPMVVVHDDYRTSPQDMNEIRQNYIDVMAELAESTILSDIASELTGQKLKLNKYSNTLSKYIRDSEYALS
jgi:DNA-directed RNA polymerase